MIYRLNNPITLLYEYIDGTQDEANTRLKELQDLYLTQESYRFSVAKEVINENDTTWSNADLQNDLEDHLYQVFNPLTGVYEQVNSLTLAKELLNQYKQDFLVYIGLDKWEIVDAIPIEPILKQNISTGTQNL
jgi:hypothetical protein